MRWQLHTATAIMLAALASSGWGQRGIIDRSVEGAYQDISKRQTRSTEREDRKKAEAEEARKKAEEEKRREERRKRYEAENQRRDEARGMTTTSSRESTTGTRTAAVPGRRSTGNRQDSAKLPGTAGGGSDPTTQEVNEVILNAVKTRTVEFDVDEAKQKPGMILLNEPKFDPKNRVRAGDTGMSQPL